MSFHPDLQSFLIRNHIAELHQEAEQRQLIRLATSSTSRRRRRSIIPTLVRAFSIAWLKHDIEREARSGLAAVGRRK